MFCLGRSKPFSLQLFVAGVSLSLRPLRSPLSWLKPPFTRNVITTKTSPLPSRRLSNTLDPESLMKDQESELFHYTTGRFLTNEDRRLRERSRIFHIPGLFEIIAKARNCKTNEIVGFRKLGEGGHNRSFLVTLRDGFKLVARIPYPILIPKAHAYASEVATMDFLRSKGLPIPQVYAYSYTPENEAGTEYMLIEYVEGTDLSEVWFNLEKKEIDSFMDQLAKLESIVMSISFPAGGSIYYATDLKELSGSEGIPLEGENKDIPLHEQVGSISLKEKNKGIPLDEQAKPIPPQKERLCLGPDVSIPLWYGKREKMDLFRGPYEGALSVLVTGANKELAYLDQFGSPRAPYRGFRRDCYNNEKQEPSEHANNLRRYLLLAPSLVPDDNSLAAFCIRHPDLNLENIKVSMDSSGLQIRSLLDWQHAAVLPLFLHAGMPYDIQNEEDEVSRRMTKPKLPDDFDELSQDEQRLEKNLLRRRLIHYDYVLSTAVYNRVHHKGLVYPFGNFCCRIFNYASAPWEGETIKLQLALIEMVVGWERFVKDGTPCPLVFTPDEIDAAVKLGKELETAEENERTLRNLVGYGPETWVPVAEYEKAMATGQAMKQKMLEVYSEDEMMTDEKRALIVACWPLEDMDEVEFEEYK